MQPRITKDTALSALLMAVRQCNPKRQVMVNLNQRSQYTSHYWQALLKSHGLEGSMGRRGTRQDNAVAESLSHLLKRERRKILFVDRLLHNAGSAMGWTQGSAVGYGTPLWASPAQVC